MKRAKVITQPSTFPVFYQQVALGHTGSEPEADNRNASEIADIRMLENLQIALFFCRAQSEMVRQQDQ